jgi:hypothetical protein
LIVRSRRVAQDDVRENRLVDLFNLTRPPNRSRADTDAILTIDGHQIQFELKSVTTGKNVSTVRDLGPGHIAKWQGKHWVIAIYDQLDLLYCKYGSPDAMKPWIDATWAYIKPDWEMAGLVPELITAEVMFRIIGQQDLYTYEDARRLQKNQYSAADYRARMDRPEGYSQIRMLEIFRDRARYVIARGATLNNRHIQAAVFAGWPTIETDHARRLRALVRNWLASAPPQPPAPGDNLRVGPRHSR